MAISKKKDKVNAERYPGSKDITNNTEAYMGFYEKTETGWERTSKPKKQEFE